MSCNTTTEVAKSFIHPLDRNYPSICWKG